MSVFGFLTDAVSTDRNTHYECRDSGANLSADAGACPDCGGPVATYLL